MLHKYDHNHVILPIISIPIHSLRLTFQAVIYLAGLRYLLDKFGGIAVG